MHYWNISINLHTTTTVFDHAPHVEIGRLLRALASEFEASNGHIDHMPTDRGIYDWRHQCCGEMTIQSV